MDFNKTVDLIIKDLEEAREIIDDLKNYPGVPAIQIELAKSKCRNAAEVIALFKSVQKGVKTEDGRFTNEVRKFRGAELKTEVKSPTPLSEEKEAEPAARNITESAIVADRFNDFPDSLNEKLGSLLDDDIVPDYFKAKPLTDLTQAIGVNDRFLFIRELFNGNPDSYNQAISKIDKARNLADAKDLMTSLTGGKTESEAAKQLLDLVKRKFPVDE
ncbi:MAG: hypothetical protein NT092_06060 [Bacteroidia bacterium]|nr:hypothetical protein [Bacteroidia bacterium]